MQKSKSVARRLAVNHDRRPLNARHNQALRVSSQQFIDAINAAIDAMKQASWTHEQKVEWYKRIESKTRKIVEDDNSR